MCIIACLMYGLLYLVFTLHELANLRGTEVGEPRPVLEQESWIFLEVKLYRLLHFKSVTILTNVTNIFRVWNVMKVNYKLWKITNCKYFVKTPFLFWFQSIIKAEIQHETREVKAIAQAMCRLFTPHQLVTCSMKGATTTTGSPRPSLPAAERNAIIGTFSSS